MDVENPQDPFLKTSLTPAAQPSAPRDDRPTPTESPLPGATFFLPVQRIASYDHNARLAPNPERERIKASIAASGGLIQPLVVTKRPGSSDFMVQQGGNTRLEIIKQLAAAAPPDDTRFARVKVIYEPWTSELDIAVNHDRENNLRGGLSFIEQARAKRYQFELFAAQASDPSTVSVKAFTAHMRERYGDDISPDLFYRMRYATDVLYEWIPTILIQGRMTLGAVRDLTAFRKRLCSVWIDHGFGDKPGFEVVFYELLARQEREYRQMIDSDSLPPDSRPEILFKLDYTRLRHDLHNELAEMDNVPSTDYQTIGLWIGAALNREELSEYEAVADLDTNIPKTTPNSNGSALPPNETQSTKRQHRGGTPPAREHRAKPPPVPMPAVPSPAPDTTDIKSLRGRCYAFALKIAQRNGFGELITVTPSTGLGFVVKDIFPEDWWDTLSKDELCRRQVCWWILMMCSHTFDLPQSALNTLPEDSMLKKSWLAQDITLVSRTMGVLGVNAHQLANVPDQDWDDCLALLTAYRQVIAAAHGADNLW